MKDIHVVVPPTKSKVHVLMDLKTAECVSTTCLRHQKPIDHLAQCDEGKFFTFEKLDFSTTSKLFRVNSIRYELAKQGKSSGSIRCTLLHRHGKEIICTHRVETTHGWQRYAYQLCSIELHQRHWFYSGPFSLIFSFHGGYGIANVRSVAICATNPTEFTDAMLGCQKYFDSFIECIH